MRPGDTGVTRKVTVGLVLRPVGLKGQLKVKPITDNPGRFAAGSRIWLRGGGGEDEAFVIRAVEGRKSALVVSLVGIDTVEKAELYRGREAYVPESEVPPLPEGVYYHYQILGLEVYTHRGRLLGTVRDILTAGEKDVYVVRGGGKEYLIPFTDDAVREVDIKGGRITLNPMEGYIPEDEV